MRVNIVKRCLRCKGALRFMSQFEVPKSWNIANNRMAMLIENGLWCDDCGIVYEDQGKSVNRVRIYRILPPNVCRECGDDGCHVSLGYATCVVCGHHHWSDEYRFFLEATHGWVNGVQRGKFNWDDDGKRFVKYEFG